MTRLAIQGIIFGKRWGEDTPGVLRDIKAAGYEGVEMGNQDGVRTPAQVRELMDSAGLTVSGYHAGYNLFTDPDAVRRAAENLAGVGASYLMCSGTAGRDAGGYTQSAEVLNRAGAICREAGVHLAYHNHNWEFFPLDGGGSRQTQSVFDSRQTQGVFDCGMDLLLAHTDPANVKLCLDIYWLACAGQDPAAFITRHAERAVYFHYKDGTFDAPAQQPISFLPLGQGQVDLPAAHAAALALSPRWIATEQDKTDGDPATDAATSATYARRILGI